MKKKVSIIVLNNFFLDTRVIKLAKTLSKAFNVEVICLHDDEMQNESEKYSFNIHRLKIKSNRLGKGIFPNLIKYAEFTLQALRLIHKSNFIHANDLTALPIAIFSKIFKRKIVIYDAHEWEIEQGPSSKFKIFILWVIESLFIQFADKYITVSPLISREYEKVYGINKFQVVMNVPNYEEITPNNYLRTKFNIPENRKIYLFAGLLSVGRDLENIMRTFEIHMKNEEADLVIMGFGPMTREVKLCVKKCYNIHFHEAISPDNLVKCSSSADFGIVGGEPDVCLSFDFSLPNKLFTYMMAEIPIICACLPEMKNFVQQNEIGVCYDPKSDMSLYDAIASINKKDYKSLKSSLKICKKRINWEEQEKALNKIYST